jgi:hypothetical protein
MYDEEMIKLLEEKCKFLEEQNEKLIKWLMLNSYYVWDIRKWQRKVYIPEWVKEEDIAYKIIDRKLWKVFVLTK